MLNMTVANDCIASILRDLIIFGSKRGRDRQGVKSYHHCHPVLQSVVRKGLVLSQLCLGQPSAVSYVACSCLLYTSPSPRD